MAQSYPGPMIPQVLPLAIFPGLSLSMTVTALLISTAVATFLGVHWLWIPGLYGVWIVSVVPHGFSHLIADNLFKKRAYY